MLLGGATRSKFVRLYNLRYGCYIRVLYVNQSPPNELLDILGFHKQNLLVQWLLQSPAIQNIQVQFPARVLKFD